MPKKTIIIGGSIAGLLAARVLSDYFEGVVLIERNRYTNDDQVRSGTPSPLTLSVFDNSNPYNIMTIHRRVTEII